MNAESQLEQIIQQKLAKVNSDETKTKLHQVLQEMCDPYVPYNTGQLANTAQVSAESVRYSAFDKGRQYASEAYNGVDMNFRKDQHPLASAEWEKAMLRDNRDEFKQRVKDILVEAINE